MPHILLDIWNTLVNKTDINPCPCGILVSYKGVGEEAIKIINHMICSELKIMKSRAP